MQREYAVLFYFPASAICIVDLYIYRYPFSSLLHIFHKSCIEVNPIMAVRRPQWISVMLTFLLLALQCYQTLAIPRSRPSELLQAAKNCDGELGQENVIGRLIPDVVTMGSNALKTIEALERSGQNPSANGIPKDNIAIETIFSKEILQNAKLRETLKGTCAANLGSPLIPLQEPVRSDISNS